MSGRGSSRLDWDWHSYSYLGWEYESFSYGKLADVLCLIHGYKALNLIGSASQLSQRLTSHECFCLPISQGPSFPFIIIVAIAQAYYCICIRRE